MMLINHHHTAKLMILAQLWHNFSKWDHWTDNHDDSSDVFDYNELEDEKKMIMTFTVAAGTRPSDSILLETRLSVGSKSPYQS